jgi:hypothetical protein
MDAQQVITGSKKPGKGAVCGKSSKAANIKAAKDKAGAGKKAGRPEFKIVKISDRENRTA